MDEHSEDAPRRDARYGDDDGGRALSSGGRCTTRDVPRDRQIRAISVVRNPSRSFDSPPVQVRGMSRMMKWVRSKFRNMEIVFPLVE